MCIFLYYNTARVTIENFWARRGQDAGKTRARRGQDAGKTQVRTFTNFDRGTVYFRHMGVLISRMHTKVYGEESFGDLFILNTQHINILSIGLKSCLPLALSTLPI